MGGQVQKQKCMEIPSDRDYMQANQRLPVGLCGYDNKLLGNILDLHKLTGTDRKTDRNQIINQVDSGTQ